MSKSYFSLGLMSGTSADGVDASIIQSNGDKKYKVILDKYFKYSQSLYQDIHNLKEQINNSRDLYSLSKKIQPIEKKITLFHANVVKEIIKKFRSNIELVGFHGQTIFHNAKEKISKQLGDGKLLSKLIKKTIPNGANITTHFNPEKNKAFPKLVKPAMAPLESVTTDILKDKSAIIPVNRIPVAI